MTNDKLLRLRDLKEYVPMSTAAIYQKMASGKFPKNHKYGGTAFWKLSEIQEWIKNGAEKVA